MNEQSESNKDIIREFCRSQGAPSADWLGRLSTNGQRECIRQWILRVMSPEIRKQLPAVAEALYAKDTHPGLAEKMYEQNVHRGEFPPEALSAEARKEYCETFIQATRHFVDRQLEEELRYGAIEFGDIDSPKLSLKNKRYHKYRNLCDQEWQRMVEGRQTARDNFHRAVLVTLLFTAAALLLTSVRIAMWCVVVGGLVTTLLIWPRRGRNRINEEGFDGFLKSISKKE
jgi:hypothetical protein